MPTYQAIFNRLKALRESLPKEQSQELQEEMDAYSRSNFKALEKLTKQCDNSDFLLSLDEANMLELAKTRESIPSNVMHSEDAQVLLHAINIKLRNEIRRLALDGLNSGELFLDMKAATKSDSDRQERIWGLEAQWQSKKRFAGLSPAGIEMMEARLKKMNQYVDLLEIGVTEVEPPLKDELKKIADDLKALVTEDQKQLLQAKMARLEFIPALARENAEGDDSSIMHTKYYSVDICLLMATSLHDAGLSSQFVDAFNRMVAGSRQLISAKQVKAFSEAVEREGARVDMPFAESEFEETKQLREIKSKSHVFVQPRGAEKLLQQITKFGLLNNAVMQQNGKLTPEQTDELIRLYQNVDMDAFGQRVNTFDSVPTFVQTSVTLYPRHHTEASSRAPTIVPAHPATVVPKRHETPAIDIKQGTYVSKPIPTQASAEELNLKEARESVSIYMKDYGKQSGDHARQGRAEHLDQMLIKEIRKWRVAGEDNDFPRQREIYGNLIAKLYLHYQSIDNSGSVLSSILENTLINLLGCDGLEFDRARSASEASREEKMSKIGVQFSRAKTALFGSAWSTVKKADPLFLYLRKHIIEHEPVIQEKLFVKNPDKDQYDLTKNAEIVLGRLEEMDRLEAAFFKSSYMQRQTFDEIISGSQALPAKGMRRIDH